MKDLIPLLKKARKKGVYLTLDDFLDEFNHRIPVCDKAYVTTSNIYDGERWLFVSCIAMFSVRIGIAFVEKEHYDRYSKCFGNTILVPYEDFDLKEWCLDRAQLKTEVPEIEWAACEDAVDSGCFSLQDLYYATM